MKLERISENQIRCTLNKDDLADRQLRISELAYGTEKAKALFRDMMQQASYELGFETEDIPLMIEAIPVSPECLVLVITKVEDPDELDTRFSKFSSDMDEIEEFEIEDDDDMEPLSFEKDFIPLSDAISPDNIMTANKKQPGSIETPAQTIKIFSFTELDSVIDLAKGIAPIYHSSNSLYKDTEENIYYLILSREEHTMEEFIKICNLASEFGQMEQSTYATLSYFEEHFTLITKTKAIQVLADL